jgi:hypothetical protein
MKRCGKCKEVKNLSEFDTNSSRVDGLQHRCRKCVRNARFLKEYGITLAEYDTMFEAQNGRCAICKQAQYCKRWLSVDHDHATGKIRALLCSLCNTALGALGESPSRLFNAMEYLAKHQDGVTLWPEPQLEPEI